jgi:hypothetical protein
MKIFKLIDDETGEFDYQYAENLSSAMSKFCDEQESGFDEMTIDEQAGVVSDKWGGRWKFCELGEMPFTAELFRAYDCGVKLPELIIAYTVKSRRPDLTATDFEKVCGEILTAYRHNASTAADTAEKFLKRYKAKK